MKTIWLLAAVLMASRACVPQCPEQDSTLFIQAKTAIAKRVLKQMHARLEVCQKQPKDKREMCAKWAETSNEAAEDVQATAFAEIDKLMAAQLRERK